LRVLSLALIIAGITAVPAAIVQQRFRQDVRMAADVTSLAVSLAVAVPLAATGFGASSLAWAWVASNAASAAILIVFVGRRWRPGFDRREAGQLLRFGLPLAASSLLVFAVLNVDYVVVSRLLGPVALGVYVLAFNLSSWPVNMFSASVRSVSLPGFARLIDRPADLGAAFTRSLGQLLSVALPICALLGGLALPAVRFVYGDRWAGASKALVWLAIVGGLRVAFELAYDFVVAIGDSRAVLYVQLLWLVALVPSLVVGGHVWGIAGIGAAQLLVAGCVICPTYLVLLKRRHVVLREVARVTARPLLGAVAAVLVARLVYPQLQEPLAGLVLAALAGLCVDALVLWPTIRRWRAGRSRPVLSATGSAGEPTHAGPAPLTPVMADAVAGAGARGAQ
jgi:PST family polysaccharide transporter